MGQPLVSIIIVNWNGVAFLPDCLDSIKGQSMQDFEVIVVDNASHDGSVELLKKSYPWVKLVQLDRNTGFATGNNKGFEQACGAYIVVLNNDTRAEPDWLARMVAAAEANPQVGMVGCRTCVYGESDLIDTIGGRVCRDGMSRGAYRLKKIAGLGLDTVVEGLYPSGCAALYKRVMLEEIGFFDDDFFAYAEDTDLGLRGQRAGWKTLLVTNAVVHHRYSATGGVFSPLKLYLVERNHYWVAIINFPVSMLLLLPFWTMVRYFVQVGVVINGRGAGEQFLKDSSFMLVTSVLRGTVDACIALPSVLVKRRRNMARSRISPAEMKKLLNRYQLSFMELLDAD